MHSKAIEAAADAFRNDYFSDGATLNSATVSAIESATQAAIAAYLAAMEAEGFVMVPVENARQAHSLSVQLQEMVHYYGLGKAKPVASELIGCTRAMLSARPNGEG